MIEYLFSTLQITSKLLFYIQQTADEDKTSRGLVSGIKLLILLADYPVGRDIFLDCNLYSLIESLQKVTSLEVSRLVEEFLRKLEAENLLLDE